MILDGSRVVEDADIFPLLRGRGRLSQGSLLGLRRCFKLTPNADIQGHALHGTNPANQHGSPPNCLSEHSTAAGKCFDICDSITDWSVSLVRKSNSTRLPPASTALARTGGIGGSVGINIFEIADTPARSSQEKGARINGFAPRISVDTSPQRQYAQGGRLTSKHK